MMTFKSSIFKNPPLATCSHTFPCTLISLLKGFIQVLSCANVFVQVANFIKIVQANFRLFCTHSQ